jgi:hypothetical protein
MIRFIERMPVMLKMLPALMLLAAATSASAANTTTTPAVPSIADRCKQQNDWISEIGDARDGGVLMSRVMMSRAGRFETNVKQEFYFQVVARLYLNPDESGESVEAAAVNGCIKKSS